MQRRRLYPSAAALLLLAALAAAGCAGEPAAPSVVLVVAQGVRADHLTPYGYSRDTAPVLSSLAAQGVLFQRAYTSSPRSAAAMASLLTGKAPQEHAVLYRPHLDRSVPSLPAWLGQRGYQTMMVNSDPGLADVEGLFRAYDQVENIDPVEVPELDGATSAVTARALQWLAAERDRSRPFLLTLVYSGPALPFDPPEPFNRRFAEAWMDEEILGRASGVWTPLARRINEGELSLGRPDLDVLASLYDGELGYLDEKLGEVIQALRDQGIMDDTWFVFTSDRGNDLGEDGHLSDATSLTEANLHVPLIIRGPGLPEPGLQTPSLIQDVDLLPTLSALLDPGSGERFSAVGISQAPLDGASRRATAVSMTLRAAGPGLVDLSLSLRNGRYRYHRDPDGPRSLVDLDTDEGALEILGSSPEIARRMEAQLAAWNGMLDRPAGTGSQAVADETMQPAGSPEGETD